MGCTELPIMYRASVERGFAPDKQIFDPLQTAIDIIKKEYEEA